MTTTTSPLFTWRDSYSVGLLRLDNQHKHLIGMLNDLQASLAQGKANDVLSQLLEELARYAQVHFLTEELLLQQHGYKKLEHHKMQHGMFVRKVSEFHQDWKGGKISLSAAILPFLKKWLIEHILNTDKQYAPFLQSKGAR